jgi:cell division transport system permease protein
MIIHNLSNSLIDSVNSKLTISLYLKDEYPRESPDTRKLLEEIEKKFTNVKIDFKTKDEVLEEMRKKDEELVSIIK